MRDLLKGRRPDLWFKAGFVPLLIFFGLNMIYVGQAIAFGSRSLTDLAGLPIVSSPLLIASGIAFIIGRTKDNFSRWLTAAYSCIWAYCVLWLAAVAADLKRTPGSFDNYGFLAVWAVIMLLPLSAAAVACLLMGGWPVAVGEFKSKLAKSAAVLFIAGLTAVFASTVLSVASVWLVDALAGASKG